MFSIEATNPRKWRWIPGIFEHRVAAEALLLSVPEAARSMQHIVEFPVCRYPVFVMKNQGFEYGDINFVRAALRGLVPHGDEDYIHVNIYAVSEDFVPAKPGIDSMGSLLHWHITDSTLVAPRAQVFDQELAGIASNA